jgi:hypothetical protein
MLGVEFEPTILVFEKYTFCNFCSIYQTELWYKIKLPSVACAR